jgi:cell division protein FtsB
VGKKPKLPRILALTLFVLLLALQARLWISEDGYREVARLEDSLMRQSDENAFFKERNAQLDADVEDLKSGFTALEERARADLGMVGPNESFYLFGQAESAGQEQ